MGLGLPSFCVHSIWRNTLVMTDNLPFWLTSHWNTCFSWTLALLFVYPSPWSPGLFCSSQNILSSCQLWAFAHGSGDCCLLQPHCIMRGHSSQCWWRCKFPVSDCVPKCLWALRRSAWFRLRLQHLVSSLAHSSCSANIPKLLHLNSNSLACLSHTRFGTKIFSSHVTGK